MPFVFRTHSTYADLMLDALPTNAKGISYLLCKRLFPAAFTTSEHQPCPHDRQKHGSTISSAVVVPLMLIPLFMPSSAPWMFGKYDICTLSVQCAARSPDERYSFLRYVNIRYEFVQRALDMQCNYAVYTPVHEAHRSYRVSVLPRI